MIKAKDLKVGSLYHDNISEEVLLITSIKCMQDPYDILLEITFLIGKNKHVRFCDSAQIYNLVEI